MAEKKKQPAGWPGGNKSNTIRSVVFTLVLIAFAALWLANLGSSGQKTEEIPISEVVAEANNPNGNIAKITVRGATLEITLKGEDRPTKTSRKDPAGTLQEQGLVDHCDGKNGEDLTECQKKYPVIEYQEDVDVGGIV